MLEAQVLKLRFDVLLRAGPVTSGAHHGSHCIQDTTGEDADTELPGGISIVSVLRLA